MLYSLFKNQCCYYSSLVFLLVFCSSISIAQSWNFKHLTVDNGLSQNSVIAITQDSLGFLWMATQDGLNQLDGTNIISHEKYFIDITGDESFRLGNLYLSRFDKLWLTNIDGDLSYFEKNRAEIAAIPELQEASCVFQEKNLRTWIGTFGDGLFWIDETSELKLVEGTEKWNIHFIHSIKAGEIIIGTAKGLYHILSETYFPKARLIFPSLKEKNISSLTQHGNMLYIGTYGDGLYYSNKINGSIEKISLLPPQSKILDLLNDSQERLWVATYGDGVYLLQDHQLIQHFTFDSKNEFSINYNDVLCLFEDQNQTIWLGTDGGGVSYFQQENNQFNSLNKNQIPNEFAIDVVRAISTSKNGTIWIGTSGKGLTSYHPKTKKLHTFTTNNSQLNSNRVVSLWHDPNDNLYIGSQGEGLSRLDKNGNFHSFSDLPCNTIWSIEAAPEGKLWLCTRSQGLILFDPNKNTWTPFRQDLSNVYSLHSDNVRVIETVDEQTIFVGTQDEGVFEFNPQTSRFSQLVFSTALSKKELGAIKDLYYKDSILWIGTQRAGLIAYHIQEKKIVQFDKQKGLPNNVVYGILEDESGFFWLSTNRGICQINPQHVWNENWKNVVLTHYTKEDGLVSTEFNTGAAYQKNKQDLFFGGLDGINWFEPTSIQANNNVATIAFLELVYPQKNGLQKRSIVHETEIILEANENNFQLYFSALQFPFASTTQYQYQLKGFQKEWVNNGFSSTATFSNIPPGDYQFLVRSKNKAGEWIASDTALHIHIKTPWYQSKLAYGSYCLGLLSLIYGIYHFQKNRWQLQTALRIEQAERLRLHELDTFKTQVFTDISHEIRTPLTLIKSMTKQLEFSKTRQIILQNTKFILDLTNKILDLSKLDAGLLKANYIQDDIIKYLRTCCASYDSIAADKNIKLSFNANKANCYMDFDKEKVRQILMNLLSNAFKFTSKNGQIDVQVTVKSDHLVLNVKDTGIGIAEHDLSSIFNRFYQSKNNTSSLGTGIGLSLVKEFSQLLGGTAKVTSILGQGSTFEIQLPIRQNASKQITESPTSSIPALEQQLKTNLSPSNNLTVLIVEDHIDLANYVATCVEERYHFLLAKNGAEGLQMAMDNIPDLIISDVLMPEMNGYELCSKLKQDEKTNHIPIILLTAKASQEDKIKGFSTGADAYLVKPFEEEELLVRIEQLILLRQNLQTKYEQSRDLPKLLSTETVNKKDAFLTKIDTILAANLDNETFNIPYLCEQVNMSRMQVHRKLKALTNQSTTQYINTYRLQQAIPLLKKKEQTVSEIAYAVGFNDPNYFSRCFVKEFGIRPSDI